MDKILILLLTLSITQSFGQETSNRHDRITKEEFHELLKHRNDFIPKDLGDTVVIVRYSGQRLMEMQNKARNISFAKNGTDTIGLRNQSWLTDKQIKKIKISAEKFGTWYPENLKKNLRKKGIASIIADETELKDFKYLNKYWLKTIYISTQKSLEDNGWVMTITNMFYDPRTNKDFEIFLPINYKLIDLVK